MSSIQTGRKTFISLTDVFNSYAGLGSRIVSVKGTEDGLTTIPQSFAPVTTFLALTDTPNSYAGAGGFYVRVNAGLSGLEFAAPTTVGGVISPFISIPFIQLTDVPGSYTGQGTKRVTVLPGETGLHFVNDTFLEEQDTPNSYTGQANNIVTVNPAETALQFASPGAIVGLIQPSLTPEVTNRGRFWVSHGDNVVTLRSPQLDNNFRVRSTIFLPQGAFDTSNPITYRGVFHAGSARANSMAIVTRPETVNTVKIRLEGGFGYASGGFVAAANATVDRFDDVANTQTATAGLGTARYGSAAFSLNGYGFTAGGYTGALPGATGRSEVERLDDSFTATQTARSGIIARGSLAGFSLNGYGFACGGSVTGGTTPPNKIVERFDDIINAWVGRSGLITSRWELSGYSLNNFGFTSGGNTAIGTIGAAPVATGTTEKFDDVANTWSARAILTTARTLLTGYSMNAFGFTEQGYSTSAAANTTLGERFDDVNNIQTTRTSVGTAIRSRGGYALNGFGFASGGFVAANSNLVDRRDDLANTITTRTGITLARAEPSGDATNEYFVDYDTENVSEFDEIVNLGTAWIAHGDNVITLTNRHINTDFRSDIVLQLPLGATSGADKITYRGPAHSRPMLITCRPDDPFVGFGFTSGGFVGAVSTVTEQYDDPTQVTTTMTALATARQGLAGYSFNGFGFTSGGNTGAVSGVTERLDPVANVQTLRTAITARRDLTSFVLTEGNLVTLNPRGHTVGGFIAAVTNTHEEFDDVSNLQTARGTGGFTARDKLAGFSINQFGFGLGGTTTDVVGGITNVNERYDLIADTWTARAVLLANRMELSGFAFGGFGYVSGGTLTAAAMLATTDRYDNVTNAWTNVGNMNTARDQLADWAIQGFGFAACGNTTGDGAPTNSNVVERYDPSTTVWTARTPAPALTARRNLAGYSNPTRYTFIATRLLVRLHGGFGFTSGGLHVVVVGTTQKYDDIVNTQTARTNLNIFRQALAGYSLNGYGFTSCGVDGTPVNVGTTERFDDVNNTQTVRANATPRGILTGYSLNGFGITSCGFIAAITGITERFNDTDNTQTARTSATARQSPAGYSLNRYGFTSGGFIAAVDGITEKFDDTGNFHTTRTSITARQSLAGYSLNGFGFTSGGDTGAIVGTTEKLDDIADTQAGRADISIRRKLSAFSLNGFGFTSGGENPALTDLGTTERFDEVANSITTRTSILIRRNLTAYATNEYFVNYSTMD